MYYMVSNEHVTISQHRRSNECLLARLKDNHANMNNERACPTPELLRHVKMSGNDNEVYPNKKE